VSSLDGTFLTQVGHVYLIPHAVYDGGRYFLIYGEESRPGDWLCLCLESGETLKLADIYFTRSRLVNAGQP
jgi:hypothetical protein